MISQNKLVCLSCRITSIDIKYQIWKNGVVFTDNVRQRSSSWYNLDSLF